MCERVARNVQNISAMKCNAGGISADFVICYESFFRFAATAPSFTATVVKANMGGTVMPSTASQAFVCDPAVSRAVAETAR